MLPFGIPQLPPGVQFGAPLGQQAMIPGVVPQMTAPAYGQTDIAELAARAGGMPVAEQPRPANPATPSVPLDDTQPEATAQPEQRPRPFVDALRGFAQNLRSGPLSERIGENRNALLGLAAGLATPSGGVMGPNMGAVASNLAGGMQLDQQAAQQAAQEQAIANAFAGAPQPVQDLAGAGIIQPGLSWLDQQLNPPAGPTGPEFGPIVTGELAAAMGLDPSRAWQQEATGEWHQVGSSGQTINLSQMGTVPPGYRVEYDEDGRPVQMVPIPGGPAATEAEAAAQAEAVRREGEVTQGNIVLQNIDRALQNAGAWTTGFLGQLTAGIPGTPAYDLARTVDTIQANVGFDALQQMRESSPTGGALGQVTVRELELLQATLGSLATAQSETQFRENLQQVQRIFLDTVHGPGNWRIDENGQAVVGGETSQQGQDGVQIGTTYPDPTGVIWEFKDWNGDGVPVWGHE